MLENWTTTTHMVHDLSLTTPPPPKKGDSSDKLNYSGTSLSFSNQSPHFIKISSLSIDMAWY